MKFAAAVMLVWLAHSVQAAELYRYVDQDGRITYSDMPPPKTAKKVEKKAAADRAAEVALPYATREAAKKFPVFIYANDCGEPCKLARELLEKRGVPYAQKDPSTSKTDATALTKLVGALEVPVLVVGKLKHVKGFESGAWNGALDEAGYPKTNPGVKPEQVRRTEPKAQDKDATAPANTPGQPPASPATPTTPAPATPATPATEPAASSNR
jgi:glutaredoxin